MISRITQLSVVAFLIGLSQLHAQDTWSLERCISYALDNSLDLRQSKVSARQSEITYQANKQLRLPDLNGNTRFDASFGRQIDRTTNDFINQQFTNQSISLNSGVTLFNGGRIRDQIRQSSLGMRAAELEADQVSNDISLQVANAYINALFAKERLANSETSLALIAEQLANTDKLIEAGTRPRNERLDLVAQLSQNEQMVVAAQNDIDIAILSLMQIMQLDIGTEFDIEVPDISLPSDYDVAALSAEELFKQAAGWQPGIKAGELRRENAEIGVSLARTAMVPTLTFGAGINSFFSSRARAFIPLNQSSVVPFVALLPGNVQSLQLNGENINLSAEIPKFDQQKVSFIDQMNENLGFGLGVNLSVPIYNQGQNKGNLEFTKLEVVRSEIANEQVRNTLKTDVQRAVADVKAAKKQYEAALRTVEANRAAYQDAEKRYTLGVSNSLDFTTAQTNRDRAEVDLIIAKYDYIFRSKIIDFYQGKKITLN